MLVTPDRLIHAMRDRLVEIVKGKEVAKRITLGLAFMWLKDSFRYTKDFSGMHFEVCISGVTSVVRLSICWEHTNQ